MQVPLCNLLTSMCDFAPCDRIVQRSFYSTSARFMQVGYNYLISNKREWNNCFIENPLKIYKTQLKYK